MASGFDLNCVPLVKLGLAAFLKDYEGRAYARCDIPSFGRSNRSVHQIVGQFPCCQGGTQLDETHLVARSKYTFTILRNWNYGLIED